MFKIMTSFMLSLGLAISLSSCVTGTTLRTARVLEKGEIEISGGIARTQFHHVAPVIIGAYGVRENFELEARCEDEYVALTPRLQLLRSETSFVDCLTFFELGYSDRGNFQWGPGIMIGRRWNFIEPYLSYRFRHFSSVPAKESQMNFSTDVNFHYVKFGSRFYIPCFWSNTRLGKFNWFVGAELGPTICTSDTFFEWAANIGFDY